MKRKWEYEWDEKYIRPGIGAGCYGPSYKEFMERSREQFLKNCSIVAEDTPEDINVLPVDIVELVVLEYA